MPRIECDGQIYRELLYLIHIRSFFTIHLFGSKIKFKKTLATPIGIMSKSKATIFHALWVVYLEYHLIKVKVPIFGTMLNVISYPHNYWCIKIDMRTKWHTYIGTGSGKNAKKWEFEEHLCNHSSLWYPHVHTNIVSGVHMCIQIICPVCTCALHACMHRIQEASSITCMHVCIPYRWIVIIVFLSFLFFFWVPWPWY